MGLRQQYAIWCGAEKENKGVTPFCKFMVVSEVEDQLNGSTDESP
jgi:hypothetical protein